jgi:putative NADH-flavin reductase
MKLFVVGATGRTGGLLVEQALARGHTVTVIVRNSGAVPARPGLTIVKGDVLNADQLTAALPGHDVVASILGRRSTDGATLLRDGAVAMLKALQASGVRRYMVVSQGLLFPSRNPLIVLLRLILASAVVDSTAMERLVRASDVAWTIVRPPRLKEGGAARGYRVKVDARPRGGMSMERVDLATFLLDEAENGTYARSIVGVGSA